MARRRGGPARATRVPRTRGRARAPRSPPRADPPAGGARATREAAPRRRGRGDLARARPRRPCAPLRGDARGRPRAGRRRRRAAASGRCRLRAPAQAALGLRLPAPLLRGAAPVSGRALDEREEKVLTGAVRGVVAAMAMTGMRQVTTGLGLVEQTPPDAILKQRAFGPLIRFPRLAFVVARRQR